jgi:hypothetical protein
VVDPFWGGGKEKLTGRMSSTVRCGQPEGNDGGGGVQGWWSTTQGVGRLFTAARCSGRGRIGRRDAGAGCRRRHSGGRKVEEEERVLHGGGGRPLQPLEAVDGRGGETVGGKTTATRPWARTRRRRPLSESGQRDLDTVGPRD